MTLRQAPSTKLSPLLRGGCGLVLSLAIALYATCLQAAEPVSTEELQQKITEIESNTELVEQTRTELLTQLKAGLANLEKEATFSVQVAELQNSIDNAQRQVQHFTQSLQEAQGNPPDLDALAVPGQEPDTLAGQITLLQAEREALSKRRSQLLEDIDAGPARREATQKRLVELQSQTEIASTAADAPAESPTQAAAQLVARARTQALMAEKRSLEINILGESTRATVSTAERAWINYSLEMADLKLQALKGALEKARASAAEQQLETTAALQEKIQNENPALKQFAGENRILGEQLQQTAREMELAQLKARDIQRQLEDIEQDFHLMRRRLEVAGRKEVLGRVMITHLENLPHTDSIKRSISQRNELIASTSLAQIDVEEENRALSEHQKYFRELIPDFDSWDAESQHLIGQLVEQRRELLRENIRSLDALLRLLLDNNDNAGELIQLRDEFHKFLLGNLLWVRNFGFLDPVALYLQLSALLSPADWLALPQQIFSGITAHSFSAALLVLLLASLLLRWQLRGAYDSLMTRPTPLSSESLLNILLGLGLTFLLVLPWPLAAMLTGLFLQASENKSAFSDALAPALLFFGKILFLLLFARLVANRQGVGRRFLKWDGRMLDSIRTELNWAGPIICLSFLLNIFGLNPDLASSGGALSAMTITVISATVIAFCVRLLRQDIFKEDAILRLALRISVVIPAAVISMQLMGLLFAAEIYLMALGRSLVIVLTIKGVSDILERWLLILRAGLERKAREEQRAQTQEGDEAHTENEDRVDVSSLSEAHAKLLSMARFVVTAVALYLIWSPSLPALNLLDSITLWHVTDSAMPGAPPRAVTLFDISLGMIILVITTLISRHLPSLSEVFMREWFNMSAGARYASSILMQYLVIAIGVSMFLSIVGWEWGKVQWLVAAMGVGIGFGLQEIVANFISGIIILFERPVRVGDIISAGGAEGTVKKINPRATIIETFDRKEHLIPNKELITGQVINWSLTENAVRVVISVGIAYGSDVRRALALLLEAAKEVDLVLPEPEPRATFEDFGDNALVLWLRCYIAEDRPGTWTKIRTLINDKFNEAGIVISFPQRDIHLDTLEPLRIEISGKSPEL